MTGSTAPCTIQLSITVEPGVYVKSGARIAVSTIEICSGYTSSTSMNSVADEFIAVDVRGDEYSA